MGGFLRRAARRLFCSRRGKRDPSFRGIFPDQLAPIGRDSMDGERKTGHVGLFLGLSFGLAELARRCSGALTDQTSFALAHPAYADLLAIGILAAVLSNPPNPRQARRGGESRQGGDAVISRASGPFMAGSWTRP